MVVVKAILFFMALPALPTLCQGQYDINGYDTSGHILSKKVTDWFHNFGLLKNSLQPMAIGKESDLIDKSATQSWSNCMRTILLPILAAFIVGCASSPRNVANSRRDLNDVYVLAILAQDQLRSEWKEFNRNSNLNLDVLLRNDSLGRISKNFERVEQVNRSSHIALRFWYSDIRDQNVILNANERDRIARLKVIVRNKKGDDGEIQFEYPERGYYLRRIVIDDL